MQLRWLDLGGLLSHEYIALLPKLKNYAITPGLTRTFGQTSNRWHVFVGHWNGLSLLQGTSVSNNHDYCIQTDASPSWGCAALFGKHWFQFTWPNEWSTGTIMAKELVPIVLGCAVWGPLLAKKSTVFQCDNYGLVQAINKGSSRDLMVMHLLRCLWFFTAFFDMQIMDTHISGVANNSTDMLSTNQAIQFLIKHPQASCVPMLLPPFLLHIVSPQKPDWTSSSFLQHLTESLSQIQHLADRTS